MITLSEPWRSLFKETIKDKSICHNIARKNQLGIAFFSRGPGVKIDIKQQEIVSRYMHRLTNNYFDEHLRCYHTIWRPWQEFKKEAHKISVYGLRISS